MRKFLFLLFAMISVAVASFGENFAKSPPLTTKVVLTSNDVFFMPVCQTALVTVDLNTQTQMVYGVALKKSYFMQSGKSVAAVPITIAEGLVAKKDLLASSNFHLIKANGVINQFSGDRLIPGSTSYSVLKHPLMISVNSQIENTGNRIKNFNQSENLNIT